MFISQVGASGCVIVRLIRGADRLPPEISDLPAPVGSGQWTDGYWERKAGRCP